MTHVKSTSKPLLTPPPRPVEAGVSLFKKSRMKCRTGISIFPLGAQRVRSQGKDSPRVRKSWDKGREKAEGKQTQDK